MRTRLLALVAATTLLVLVAFLVPLAVLLRTVAEDRAVQGASGEAQALSALVATADRDDLALAVQQVDATSAAAVSVYLPDGTVLGTPAPRTPLVELAAQGRSASGEDAGGGREIVFAVRTDAGPGAVIRTVVPADALTPGVGRAWLLLAVLGFGLLVISLFVADRLGRTLVRSAEELAAVSRRLAAGELDARVRRGGPGELAVVGGALNGLAARIADLLRDERESVADLAHRVRTPLTSLRLDAEALADPDDADRIGARVDAVQRAVTQAIDQARGRTAGPAVCDAADTVRGRVAFWSVLAEDTDRGVVVDIAPGPLPVALARGDLEAAVDALLGNVFAHTPDGTAFVVRLQPRSGGVLLSVADSGPGLPPGTHVPQRGASGSGSTGLGLDIARRAAEQTGGQLAMGVSATGGLEVVVRLRAPA